MRRGVVATRVVATLFAAALCGCQAGDEPSPKSPAPAPAAPLPAAASVARVELARLDPRPGDCAGGRLPAAVVHVVPLALSAGEYLHLSLEQHEVDLRARLLEPPSPPLIFDSPVGAEGTEHVVFVAADAAEPRIEIEAWDPATAGAYRLCVEARRPATDRDRDWSAAVRAHYQARYGGDADLDRRAAGYRRAAELAAEVGEPAFQARALIGLAELELDRHRPAAATGVLEQALAIRRRLDDLKGQGRVLDLLGSAWRRQGELERSHEAYEQALVTWRRLGDPRSEASALNNLGLVAKQQDRYRLAVDRYGQALALWQRIGDRCNMAQTHSNLGTFYDLFGDRPSAWDHFRHAQSLLERCGNDGIVTRTLPVVLTRMGDLLAEEGQAGEALSRYRQALDLRRQAGDRAGEAGTLNSIALASAARDPRAAFAAYRSALAIYRELRLISDQATTLRNLAALHESAGDLSPARESNREALELARRADNHEAQALAQLGLARLERRAGDLEQAERWARRAVELVDARHQEIARGDLRTAYLAGRRPYYDLLITILAERHRQQPGRGFDARAFEVADGARAKHLLELVSSDYGTAPSVALEAVTAEINAGHRQWLEASQSGASSRLRPIEVDLRWLLARHHELTSRPRSPPAVAPTAPELGRRQILDPDSTLLVYHFTASRGWLWVVTRSTMTLHDVAADRARLAGAVADVRTSDLRSVEASAPALEALAHLLIGPVVERLEGRRRLWVSGPGLVQAVPWAALPHPATGEPLGLDREIVQVPSLAVLGALRERAQRRGAAAGAAAGATVAIVANGVYGPDDPRLPRPLPTAPPEPPRLDPLPASLAEARAAARWLGVESRTFTGFEARRELLARGALGSLRVLHLATHTLLDVPDVATGDGRDALPVIEAADLAALVFSRYDSGGRPVDGYLRAYEIRRLTLDADLVVLSACRSVLGEDVRGEGLIGLTHAFLAAGARRVVASLWDVDDRATAALMEHFYRGFGQGLAPSLALSHAQTAMRRQEAWQAPHFWAGFACYGDPSRRSKKGPHRAALDPGAPAEPRLD